MSEKTEPVRLVAGRSDVELAEELRARFHEAAVPLLAVIEEMTAARLLVSFQLDRDAYGKLRFALKIMREF